MISSYEAAIISQKWLEEKYPNTFLVSTAPPRRYTDEITITANHHRYYLEEREGNVFVNESKIQAFHNYIDELSTMLFGRGYYGSMKNILFFYPKDTVDSVLQKAYNRAEERKTAKDTLALLEQRLKRYRRMKFR